MKRKKTTDNQDATVADWLGGAVRVRELIQLCLEKALVHRTAGNLPGASEEYDHIITMLEPSVKQEGWPSGDSLPDRAAGIAALGDHASAVADCDRAIEILKRLVCQEVHNEPYYDLAKAFMEKAAALALLGDTRGAWVLQGKATATPETVVRYQGHGEAGQRPGASPLRGGRTVQGSR